MRRCVVVEAVRANARMQDGIIAVRVPAGKRHKNGEVELFWIEDGGVLQVLWTCVHPHMIHVQLMIILWPVFYPKQSIS